MSLSVKVVNNQDFSLSKNKLLNYQYVFDVLKEHKKINNNSYYIGKNTETCWYNRFVKSDSLVQLENDGLYSLNLPYFKESDSNPLKIPVDSIIISSAINYTLDEMSFKKLKSILMVAVYDVIQSHNGNVNLIKMDGNDIFYDGRQFLGREVCVSVLDDTRNYIESSCLILHHKQPNKFNLVGICDLVPNVTAQDFIDKITEVAKLTFNN